MFLSCFLPFITADGKDGHGLKLEKVGPPFSSFNAVAAKLTKKLFWVVLPDVVCMISSP